MISRRQVIAGVGALAVASAIPLSDGVALTNTPHPHNPMSIWEIVKSLDARFDGKDGAPYYYCETGEPYVEFNLGGVMSDDGWPYETVAKADQALIDEWLKEFWAYADQRRSEYRLYWRQRPVIEWEHRPTDSLFRIYSRLIITDKPELPEAEFQSHIDRERHAIYDARTSEYVGDVRGLPA